MFKRTLIALEAAYLLTFCAIELFTRLTYGPEYASVAPSVWAALAVFASTGQLALIPAAYVLARHAPLFRGRRFLKLLGLQWLSIIPAGVLLMMIGAMIEHPPDDYAVVITALLLGLPLGLLTATTLFLPALLTSTFFIERASRHTEEAGAPPNTPPH